MEKKILLVDGNSILNRGFYALPLLTDANGIYTNAVLGFLNILIKVLTDEKPDYITVAFDVHAPTFRHKMYDEYKGNRKPMADELKMQLPIIREVLSAMGINIVEMEGYEADDLLGTLAKKSEKAGLEVTLLSGDRDLLQIASEKIKIAIPKTQGGKTETFLYHASDFISEKGVTPEEFIDVKALMGDSSDNYPGVTKVGEKTAYDLIKEYHSLENLYEHIDDITKKALHENLVNDKDKAFFCRTLAKILTDAPIEPELEKSGAGNLLNASSMDVFLKYSMKSIITKLENLEGSKATEKKEAKRTEYIYTEDFNEVNEIFTKASKCVNLGVYYVGDEGVALSLDRKNVYFIGFFGFVTKDYVSGLLCKTVSMVKRVVTYSIKNLYPVITDYSDKLEDIEILAYLTDPIKGEYPFTYLTEKYLNEYVGSDKELGSDTKLLAATVADMSIGIFDVLNKELINLSMGELYRNIEMPLSFVLYSMEKEGILANREALKAYSEKLISSMSVYEKKIYEEAGSEFNINSPKQLGEILFERLGIKGGKKTKTGYSTAADVLEALAPEYPIVNDILEYRGLSKLNSTYAEGLQNYIKEDGRIHTHFNQTITATGRISSTEPNLQNIPVRTEMGREFRKIFYPKEGYIFVDADYSQIELRLMAHMSGDETMISAFRDGKDIHRSTASVVFNTPFDEVTDIQRRNAKAVNFGIIYGISAFGLGKDIGVDNKTAKKYIDDYFEKYPKIKAYLDRTVEKAKEDGYTRTLYGRIRQIPELKSSNFMQRSFGERVAMNAPIQGTAADIMKIAMINIFNRLKKEAPDSHMLIQVHDEVLVETKKSELDVVIKIITEEMESAADLSVKLISDANSGMTWYEAK